MFERCIRRLAVRRVDDWRATEVEMVLLRDRFDARARTDEDRRDQTKPRRIERAAQRALVAGVRDGGVVGGSALQKSGSLSYFA